jgi:cyanophycinase
MKLRRPLVLPWLVLTLLAGCGGGGSGDAGAAGGASPRTGRLVIVGGALEADNAEVYQSIVEARDGDGPICVVPTASGVPESSMSAAVKTFQGYVGDSAAVGVFLAEQNAELARDPGMAAQLAACSGFFFTGGDQARVVDTFLPGGDTTQAFRALRRRFEEGAVVSGSSAGAAMMSGVMIASGSSAGAVEHGIVYGPGADVVDGGERIRRGLGFFERAILDQHFLSRGRFARLVVATLATDSLPIGLGIDENTALVVDGDRARVVGASGVVVVDARGASDVDGHFGSGVRVTLAGTGDVVDLNTFQVTRGTGKTPVDASGSTLEAPADPFARWAFLHLLSGLAHSAVTEASFAVPGGVLTVREGDGFSAAASTGEGVQGEVRGFSAGPFVLDLRAAPGS